MPAPWGSGEDQAGVRRETHGWWKWEAALSSHPTTFSQATFKGWMDIMYAAVDSREVSGARRDVVGERAGGEDADQRHNGNSAYPQPNTASSGAPKLGSLRVEGSTSGPLALPAHSEMGSREQPTYPPQPLHPIPSHPNPILSHPHLIPSHPVLSHPIPSSPLPIPYPFHPLPSPSHPIPFCPIPIPSHPIPSRPVPSHPIPSCSVASAEGRTAPV